MYEGTSGINGRLAQRKGLTNGVLLVDDDPDIVTAMRLSLEPELKKGPNPYEILSANNGRSALEVFAEKRPRIMVLDIMLPQLSGFLVMERLRQSVAKDEQPKIFVITGNSGRRIRQYAETLGVNPKDYFIKPFKMEGLVERVREYAV